MSTPAPQQPEPAESADRSRRSFIFKLGAGVSTALAAGAVAARSEPGNADDSAVRLAQLQDEQALRKLHEAFEQALDHGRYEEAVELFADDAQVTFNGGVFANRSEGISRLFRERFPAGKTGKRMEPAPGYEIPAAEQADRVTLTADRLGAEAAFPYSIRVGAPLETASSFASMAQLHGEGVRTWWEGGVYRVSYRKDLARDRWYIGKLEYHTLSRADYRPGRSHASPIAVAPMAVRYPEDPHGPDALVPGASAAEPVT